MEFFNFSLLGTMRYLFLLFFAIPGCSNSEQKPVISAPPTVISTELKKIEDIALPAGFARTHEAPRSFGEWLRQLGLKKDKTVYLYNGEKKKNQLAQFAVIDISRSKTDLQQCADVVMRLRAEYLFTQHKYDSIQFMDYSGKWYNWTGRDNRQSFDVYLNKVFGWCGSASLEKQLARVPQFSEIKMGDVLISGGFPGHAMMVVDMAKNVKGEKIFLLAQGYQPAQDPHVLVNPGDTNLSPWYRVGGDGDIYTPEWTFKRSQLSRW